MINFPPFITNDTPIPEGLLVRSKKRVYADLAIEKLRRLHNAGWKWVKGEPLDPDEEGLLQEQFPGQWPDPPTMEQFHANLTTWWEPRQQEAQGFRAKARTVASKEELNLVDLDGLID